MVKFIKFEKKGNFLSFFLSKIRKEQVAFMKAFLILEDGTVFSGTSIGAEREVISEIVFNTSMTGYLEVLTDPTSRPVPIGAVTTGDISSLRRTVRLRGS